MNQPWNVIKASQIAGVILDCDLSTGNKIGGGTATDNTTALNALLATASATNPIKLILDGPSLTTGIVISSNGYTCIEGIGWGSGIYVKSASNHDAIQNGIPYTLAGFQPTGTAPAQTGSVSLRNFMINGNRGNGTTGNSNSGNPRGITGTYWYSDIALYAVKGLRIEDMFIYDAPTYSVRLMNCSDVVIDGNEMINPNTIVGANNDCVHIDGPASDIGITNNYFNNNFSDDAVAINCPEGYSGGANITRVTVVGNRFNNTYSALRVYGGANALAGEVVFSSNTGNVFGYVMTLGFGATAIADASGRSIIAANNTFQSTGCFVSISDNLGDLLLSDNVWDSPSAAGQFILGAGGAVSSLTVNNCHIYRSAVGNNTSTPLLSATAALTIARLTINNFKVINQQGQSYAAIASLLSMTNVTIAKLFVNALDMTNVTALASSYTGITSMSGTGLGSQVSTKTAAYTLLPTDGTVFVDCTNAAVAVTLPAVQYAGHEVKVVKIDSSANAVTLTGTISGAANPTLATQYAKARFETSGTIWYNV